jgi:hypothetical protein
MPNYAASNDFGPKLADVRVVLVGASGQRYKFHVYRQAFVEGLFSTCKRVRLFPVRDPDGDTVKGRYHVTYRGKPVPEERYALHFDKKRGFKSFGQH